MADQLDPYYKWLGIRPEEQPANHYRLLGIAPFESDRDVIIDAAAQRMAHVRTYQLGPHVAATQQVLNELAAAKACLLDPKDKAAYDRQLQLKLSPPEAPPLRLARSPWLLPAALAGIVVLVVAAALGAVVLLWGRAPAQNGPIGKRPSPWGDGQPSPTILAPQGRFDRIPSGPTAPMIERWSRPADMPPAALPSDDPRRRGGPPAMWQRRSGPPRTDRPSTVPAVPGEANASPFEEDDSPFEEDKDVGHPGPANPAPPTSKPPTPPQKEKQGPVNTAPGVVRIAVDLPSGARLTDAMVSVPQDWKKLLFVSDDAKDAEVYYAPERPDPKTPPEAAIRLALDNAKATARFDGAAVTLYGNGHLQTLAFYAKGNLNGTLQHWTESGKRLLFAEYKNDKKDGLVCLFQDDLPWLVQEWNKDKPGPEYLVKWTKGAPRIIAAAKMSPEETGERNRAVAALAELQGKIKDDMGKWKRKASQWYRKEVEQARLERFKAGAADRRKRQSERGAAKREEADRTHEKYWRDVFQQGGY